MARPSTTAQLKALVANATVVQKTHYTGGNVTSAMPASMFTRPGIPLPGGYPSSLAGQSYDSSSLGAIPLPQVQSGNKLLLVRAKWLSNFLCGGYIIDRLVATNNIDATSTASQTVNSAALPSRAGSGAGTEIWLTNTIGLTTPPVGATVVVTYTNSAGVSGRQTAPMPLMTGTVRVDTADRMALQDGDVGVQSIQSIQLSAGYAAGTFGLIIAKRICSLPGKAAAMLMDYGSLFLGFPTIEPDACLQIICTNITTSTPTIDLELSLAEYTP